MNAERIAGKINGVLEGVANSKKGEWHEGPWTHAVLVQLGKLGHDLEYYVCSSQYDSADQGEWLFDQCWLDYKKANKNETRGHLRRLVMALESEWKKHPTDIFDDYEKLFVVRADLRVLIFQAMNAGKIELLFCQLKEREAKSKNRTDEDKYLLCGLDIETGGFLFERIGF